MEYDYIGKWEVYNFGLGHHQHYVLPLTKKAEFCDQEYVSLDQEYVIRVLQIWKPQWVIPQLTCLRMQ